MTDMNFFGVKRAGRHFSFLKRAGRHQKAAGCRALQKRLRQNPGYIITTSVKSRNAIVALLTKASQPRAINVCTGVITVSWQTLSGRVMMMK